MKACIYIIDQEIEG